MRKKVVEVLGKGKMFGEYTCYICNKEQKDGDKNHTKVCANCQKIINACLPNSGCKARAMALMDPEVAMVRNLIARGVNPKRLEPVCRVCKTKYNSNSYLSDPVNLICKDCYHYIGEILPPDRQDLRKVKLDDLEFSKLKIAWEKDKYYDEDNKKLEWFLAEYGGNLPTAEKMEALVGVQQAQRIFKLNKQRRREEAERIKAEQKLHKTAKAKQSELLKEYDQIMPSLSKLIQLVGNKELAELIDQLDKKRRYHMYRKMSKEEQKEFQQRRAEIRRARGF